MARKRDKASNWRYFVYPKDIRTGENIGRELSERMLEDKGVRIKCEDSDEKRKLLEVPSDFLRFLFESKANVRIYYLPEYAVVALCRDPFWLRAYTNTPRRDVDRPSKKKKLGEKVTKARDLLESKKAAHEK